MRAGPQVRTAVPRAGQREAFLVRAGRGAGDPGHEIAADDRPVLERVAGATAGDPDIVEAWVSVQDEFGVRCRLVLADARLHHGRIGQVREPSTGVAADLPNGLGIDEA